ncbi:hypothetical protein [Hydrogenimonas sp.]
MNEETQENLTPAEAAEKVLEETRAHGFMRLIDLDPYFGTFEMPMEKEIALLAETYPEDFAFFKTLMDDLKEEMEIHFETTEMYEDEEFDAFEEDCRLIKERYSQMLKEEHLPRLEAFVRKVTQEG